ncbi:hypothetical protein G3R49_02580 [Shewanella sp. WXL01]|uniref:hypothetical protein n=1 Tax=Shewanella sp. WXL01 TaxID=2709721 RepID=UPI0014385D97|nr:hypothetical protein [Shewanella sp. WXL01]NKF49468.1 hypothetical protein [Shewanella sp. WXL01]
MLINRALVAACMCAVTVVSQQTHASSEAIIPTSFASEAEVSTDANASADESSDTPKPSYQAEVEVVPFIFATETLSTAFGGAGVIKHAGQAQATALGVGLYTANDSWMGFLGLYNYQLPGAEQWLFSFEAFQGHYEQGIYFLEPHESPRGETEKVISVGDEGFAKLHIEYVLPIASGKQGAARSLARRQAEEISWNPLESGVSSVKLTPFVKNRKLEVNETLPDLAKGAELLFEWDNRDTSKDTLKGGRTSLTFTYGMAIDDQPDWSIWEFEQSAFFPLGSNKWLSEQVLAANVYVADTPSWNKQDGTTGNYHRPPTFAGVGLGGFDRLRGYSSDQFTGRSAVNYSLEYRVKPHWQPLQNWPVFNLYKVPWWQWVVFGEMGKVANSFSASELHTDMKYVMGAGVRFEVEDIVVRLDLASNTDENQFWVMVNQAF